MRQKASELVKGEWYCDSRYEGYESFLRFDEVLGSKYVFSEIKGNKSYSLGIDGKIPFASKPHTYLPTPEDIEKYNLNEKE